MPKTRNKKIRNYIYIGCGIVILISLAILLIRSLVGAGAEKSKALLFFETIMLVAFGISWLVKGRTLESIRYGLDKTLKKLESVSGGKLANLFLKFFKTASLFSFTERIRSKSKQKLDPQHMAAS